LDNRYCVFNQHRQTFVHLGVGVANTHFQRLRGLLGRGSLRSDEGLWVIPSIGIHTVGLCFPIDVIYLDKGGRVIHLIENLRPFRVSPLRFHCDSVLELPTRCIYTSNTQLGDQLLMLTPEQMPEYWTEQRHVGPGLSVVGGTRE